MSKGKMVLSKWVSNSAAILSSVPEDHRETNLPISINENHGTLGVRWNPSSDSFTLAVHSADEEWPTKRKIASGLAKTFDPLGWASPITIRGKILIQELWKLKIDWDSPVPKEIAAKWTAFQLDRHEIFNFSIPRCYFQPMEEVHPYLSLVE